MKKKINRIYFLIILVSFFILGVEKSRVKPYLAAEEAASKDCAGCLWGGIGEKTTYSAAYSPLMAPEIGSRLSQEERERNKQLYPLSPEDAICVVRSDGSRYCYYYQEKIEYRPVSEFRMVFEPMEKLETREVEEFNPCSGNYELRQVTEPVQTTFPVLHEKEFIHYEPVKVLVRVIIPGGNFSPDNGRQEGGAASIQFSSKTTP